VDKGDNCRLTARQFGLGASNELYVVKDVKKSSLFFPDVKIGKVVGFKNDSEAGFLLLTFESRSLRLPYAAPPTDDEVISNELSVAQGLVKIGNRKSAGDLLEDTDHTLRTASAPSFTAAFIKNASVDLFAIKSASPDLSGISHSLLQLAYLRSALEKEPEVRDRGSNPGCGGISGQDITIQGSIYRFGFGSPCGFVLVPRQDGSMSSRVSISDSFIFGGTQVLDGIAWIHDTFVGSRIRYHGGRILLNALLFVDCTFDIVDSPNGDRVIDFAISRPPSLSIESESQVGFKTRAEVPRMTTDSNWVEAHNSSQFVVKTPLP